MGMRSVIRSGVRQAFNAMGDIVVPGDYIHKTGEGVRDVATGTTVYPTTSYPIRQIAVVGWTQKETDRDPTLLTTEKMLWPAEQCPIVPTPDGTVVDDDGRVFEIVKLVSAPTDAVTILSVRRAAP